MSIIRVKEAVSVSTMVFALGSVTVPKTFTSSVNSIAHISSMLYPATLQVRLFSLSLRQWQMGQGFSSTRNINLFTDGSERLEASLFRSIR